MLTIVLVIFLSQWAAFQGGNAADQRKAACNVWLCYYSVLGLP